MSMDNRQKDGLIKIAGGNVRFNCPMAQYTTLRVGGQSEALYNADDLQELRQVILYLNEECIPYLVIGRGSNLLIRDKGIEGLAIRLTGALATIEHDEKDDLNVLAGAGLQLAELLSYCRDSGLGGLECFAGIPGTVGGAVIMNAGAFGKNFGSVVQEIHLITPKGDLVYRNKSQLRFSYRKLEIEKGAVAVRALLRLDRGSKETVAGLIKEYLKKRKESQPLEYPSAGSVFKNPPNQYAAKLIENAGLKGSRIGGAMISEKHANFIVNTGGAKAKDILDLLYLAREKVKKKSGIELEPEIRIVGN